MEDKKRDDEGRYQPEHSDKEFLDAVKENEPAGTNEVAKELGIARQGADYRLNRLEKDGKVSKKMVGNSLVWSIANSSQ